MLSYCCFKCALFSHVACVNTLINPCLDLVFIYLFQKSIPLSSLQVHTCLTCMCFLSEQLCVSVVCVCVCVCVCVHKLLFLEGVRLRDSVYVAEAILFLKVNDLIVNHVASASFPPP